MRTALSVAAMVVGGCSFIGARGVPDKPPAPEHCPTAVVMVDMGVAAFTLVPLTIATVNEIAWSSNSDMGALGLIVFGVPMGILGATYLISGIYGMGQRNKCERLQNAEADAYENQQRAPEIVIARAPVVGDAPMHCAMNEPDVGECFTDEVACGKEAERSGGACEPRVQTWCFDVQEIAALRADTTCAASLVDCQARRTMYARDKTSKVTACGTYAVRQ